MDKLYRNLKVIIWILAFAVVLLGANLLYERLSAQAQPEALATMPQQTAAPDQTDETQPPQPAPDFTVYDGEGNAVALSDFQGQPVILNFWASWCGPCVSEMPELQSFYDAYGQQIHFVLVNLTDGAQETLDSAQTFLEEQGYTFPVYFDTDISAAASYGVSSIPVTYFIDAQGNLQAWAQGAMTENMIQQGVDMLLEE